MMMGANDLAKLIEKHGGIRMARTVAEFERQFAAAFEHGWDLRYWHAHHADGLILFEAHEEGSTPAPSVRRGPPVMTQEFGRAVIFPGDPDYPVIAAPPEPPDDVPLAASDDTGLAAAQSTILCVYADEDKRTEFERAAPAGTIVLMRDQWFRAEQVPEAMDA